jgi:hypothetical protein
MVPILFATGEQFNLLERGTVSVVGTADPLFGVGGLQDGRASKPMRFSGMTAVESIIVDLDAFTHDGQSGDFETWDAGQPVGWTVEDGGGTGVVEETTDAPEVHGGTSAARMTGGDLGVAVSRAFVTRAGERRRHSVWMKCNDGSDVVKVRIKNLRTGRYLNSSFQWQATPTFAFTHTGTTTYTNVAFGYVIESLFKCGLIDLPLIVITYFATDGSIVFVDDAADWPAVDLVGLFGLKVDDRCTVNWQTSSNGSSFSSSVLAGDHEAGFLPDQKPNLYLRRDISLFGGVDQRFHRVQFDNDTVSPAEPREIAELVLCQATQLGRMRDWGAEFKEIETNISNRTVTGDVQAFGMSRWRRRALQMQWAFPETSNGASLTNMREARDYFWGRARGQRHNILFVPDSDMNTVMLMRGTDEWSVRKLFHVYGENEVTLAELPFVSAAL